MWVPVSGDGFADHPRAPQLRNDLSGTVYGSSIQAQHIHGGIHFTVPAGSADLVTRPDQLPPQTIRFINRAMDLESLDDWFSGGSSAVTSPIGLGALHGLHGVGKTALACAWGNRAQDLFPDGKIYVDYAELRHGAGGDVSEAVAMGLRALGVSEAYLPKSLADRVALFRSRSAGRRLLVVLDDVSQAAQVTSLLPAGPGSVLLATSHRRLDELALTGARFLAVGPLDRDGGLGVLADRCGEAAVQAEPSAAGRLVELCAGLPIALQVVASRLLTGRRRLTMTGLAEELADEAGRLARMSLGRGYSVSAVFDRAYRELPAEAARLYRLLGWLPGRTFDGGTAAAAADLDAATAQSLLDTLEAASLVELLADGRFRFHDLVRLHARERATEEEPPTEPRALVQRVATHYLTLTAFADRAIRRDRLRIAELTPLLDTAADPFAAEGGPGPLPWLRAERFSILSVLRAAAQHGLHTQVWQLAEAFTVLFLHQRHLAEWRESLELGAAAAAADTEPAAEARLRSLLSRPLMDLRAHDLALAALERAVACAEVAGHPVVSASVQEFFGRYWDRFDRSRAITAYQRSRELNSQAGERRGAAIAAYFLGCAQDADGDHEAALATLADAHRELLVDLADPRMAARVAAAIGLAHDHLGESEAAVRSLTEAAQTLHELNATHYEAQALVDLASIAERAGADRGLLQEYLTRALEIYQAGGSPLAEDLRMRLSRLAAAGDDTTP